MNDLVKVINKGGQLVVSSRQVSEDFEKEHKHVLETIRNLIAGNSAVKNMIIESTYEFRGRQYPEYLLTRDGFSLLVMGFTGAKALQWKLKYIEAFNSMEQHIKKQLDTTQLSPELQMFNNLFKALAKQELEQKQIVQAVQETKEEVQAIRNVVAINANAWKSEVTNLLNKIAKEHGGTAEAYRDVRNESYKLLNERAGANLDIRLINRRRKVLEETGSKSKANKISKLDVIADDKRLTEIYLAIVKELAIKYKVA